MGQDFWPFGAAASAHVLERMTHYAWSQRLTARHLTVDQLFPASVQDPAKIGGLLSGEIMS